MTKAAERAERAQKRKEYLLQFPFIKKYKHKAPCQGHKYRRSHRTACKLQGDWGYRKVGSKKWTRYCIHHLYSNGLWGWPEDHVRWQAEHQRLTGRPLYVFEEAEQVVDPDSGGPR
jgi:hypothetical protein